MFKAWKYLTEIFKPTDKVIKETKIFNKKSADLDKQGATLEKKEKLQDFLDEELQRQFDKKLKLANADTAYVENISIKDNKIAKSIEYSQSDSDIIKCLVAKTYEKKVEQEKIENFCNIIDNEKAITKSIVHSYKIHNLLNSINISKIISLGNGKLIKEFNDMIGNAMESAGEYSGLVVSIFKLVKSIIPNLKTVVTDLIPKVINNIKEYINDDTNRETIRTVIQNFNQSLISRDFYEKKIKTWAKYIPGLLKTFNYLLGYEGTVQEVNVQKQFTTILKNSSGQVISRDKIIENVNLTTNQLKNFPQKIKPTQDSVKTIMSKSSIMDLVKNHKNYTNIKIPSLKQSSYTNAYGNYNVPLSTRLNTKLSELPKYYEDIKALNEFDEISINGTTITQQSTLNDLLENCYSLSDIAQIKDYIGQDIANGLAELLQDYPDIYGLSIQPSQIAEGLKENFDRLKDYSQEKYNELESNIPKDVLNNLAIDEFRNKINGVIENYPSINMDISDLISDRDISVNNAIINVNGKNYASPLYSTGVIYDIKHPYMEYLYKSDKKLYEELLKGLYEYALEKGHPIDIDGQFTDFYTYLDSLPKDKLKLYLLDLKNEHSNSDIVKSTYQKSKVNEYIPQNDKINVQFIIKNENGRVVYQTIPSTSSLYEEK